MKNREENITKVFLEIKTNRRGISKEQLVLHLEWLNSNDKLLVITPRLSDRDIIKELNSKKIIFKTWSEISEYLKRNFDKTIAKQFIEYGKLSGEFDEFGEITDNEIKIFIENLKLNFDKKIEFIFSSFSSEYDFKSKGLTKIKPNYADKWGRRGVELNFENEFTSYGQWWAISYYYNTNDHGMKFRKDVPEIVFSLILIQKN